MIEARGVAHAVKRVNRHRAGDQELTVVDLNLLNKELKNTVEQSTIIDQSPVAARPFAYEVDLQIVPGHIAC